MKVVLVITSLDTGGAQNALLRILRRLDRSRFSPSVISLTTKGEIGSLIEGLGIPVKAIGMRPGVPSVGGFIELLQELRISRPDIVHTWMYHADLLGGLASRFSGTAHIAWGIRNSDLDERTTKRSTRAVVKICALLSRWLPKYILVCSDVAKTIHAEIGYDISKMVVVPNGIELEKFKPNAAERISMRCELNVAPEASLVGLIARFDPQKNHRGFFQAMRIVCERYPGARCVLAGQGTDRANSLLLEMVNENGLAHKVFLLGLRTDIPRILAGLDVLVSSSLYGEAFPNVVAEAMATGLSCVVTDVGDSSYIVGDFGRVVAPGDVPSLAKAVEEELLRTEASRALVAIGARQRVAALFDIRDVVRRYEAFYELVSSN